VTRFDDDYAWRCPAMDDLIKANLNFYFYLVVTITPNQHYAITIELLYVKYFHLFNRINSTALIASDRGSEWAFTG